MGAKGLSRTQHFTVLLCAAADQLKHTDTIICYILYTAERNTVYMQTDAVKTNILHKYVVVLGNMIIQYNDDDNRDLQ